MAAKIAKVRAANVFLWGKHVGAVAWDEEKQLTAFEYARSFLKEGLDISPVTLPKRAGIFTFPDLRGDTFLTLPGVLADSLPDRFGNAIVDLWLTRNGRSKDAFSPVERLCYVGSRGMGALEFKPAIGDHAKKSIPMEITELTALAQMILDDRAGLQVNFADHEEALTTIMRVGTSAGGARPKAVIAWNRSTNEVRSGQVPAPQGFEPWILKFDGVRDDMLGDSKGYGRIEFAYSRMAKEAGIQMEECRLYHDNGRSHFMTRRFDRDRSGKKVHMQSLCGLAHYDFKMPGAYGYEQALSIIQRFNLGNPALTEMYRRMCFNVVARNQDDHTRNIAFLMNEAGDWRLAPAFDVIWAYNPAGEWTNQHQMSIGGKRDNFTRGDLGNVARQYGIRNPDEILDRVIDVVGRWPQFAEENKVSDRKIEEIRKSHRLTIY